MNDEARVVQSEGGIIWTHISHSHTLNAPDPATHRAIAMASDTLDAASAPSVTIHTGTGARAVCVGSDVKSRAATNADDHPPIGFAGRC